MESLSRSLQPYKDLVGQWASIVTIAQFFSGTLVCKDIYNKKSTQGTSAVPFIGGVVVGILMLKLGLLMGDAAMIQVNVACILLNFIYTVIFQYYSKDKTNEVFKPTSIGVGVVAVCLGYASIEDEANLEFRFGLIVTVLLLVVIGSPLLDVNTIIEAQDASSIPFPLTFMGTLVSTLWLLYGIILNNIFMVVQNVVGLLLCVVQLFLIFKYPGSSEQAKKKKKVSKKD